MASRDLVGFIGIGAMGAPMVRNLVRRDFELLLHDVVSERAAALAGPSVRVASSVGEVAESARWIVTMLPSLEAIEQVALGREGLVDRMSPGSTMIEMSTSKPGLSRLISQSLAQRGVAMLDAPVSGTTPAAESATLVAMVGGTAEILELCRPVLGAMCSQIYHCGGPGQGNAMKLALNLLVHVPALAAFEAMALAVKVGLDPVTLLDLLANGPAGSPIVLFKLRKAVERDFEPGSSVHVGVKDLELAIDLAREAGVPMLLPPVALQTYDYAEQAGLGDRDSSVMITLYERLLGIRVAATE